MQIEEEESELKSVDEKENCENEEQANIESGKIDSENICEIILNKVINLKPE